MAVTAAGPRESSYGCYCHYQSKPYNTCLGDLFSVTWLEDLDEVCPFTVGFTIKSMEDNLQ